MPLLSSVANAAVEGFSSSEDPAKKKETLMEVLSVLLAFVLSLVILGFVGKYLWNNVVVELVSVAKPARSFWQIIGLMVLISLVHP